MEFGDDIRKKAFTIKEWVLPVNHGAYGVVPRTVQESQMRVLREMYDYPDLWWRYNLRKRIDESREHLANFVNSDANDIVFVQNATTGIAAIIKSLKYSAGDRILCTDNTYNAVKHICSAQSESLPEKDVHVDFLTLKFPIQSEDDVVSMYRDYFINNKYVKVAIIDHISSQSAIQMPVKKLIPLCREHGVLSLIDGAHAPGQIPLDLRSMDADFYAGNLHKWLFTPKGCAFLCIKKDHQQTIRPVVTSNGYQKGYLTEFFHQGTRDDSPYVVTKDAIAFYNDIGGHEKISQYIGPLLEKAVNYLTNVWGTSSLPIPKSMEAPFMRLVQLPKSKVFEGKKSFDELEKVIIDHIVNHGVTAQYTFADGKNYIRVSANVYNTMEDYEKLADFIKQLAD